MRKQVAPYQQRCRDCSGKGCRWCVTGFIQGNGSALESRGQLLPFNDPFTGATNMATVVK